MLTLVVGSFVSTALMMFVWKPDTVVRGSTRFHTAPPTAGHPTPSRGTWLKPTTQSAPAAGPGIVWANTRSHIYHFPGHRWYGATIRGEYESEQDAVAKGNRAALNERRPANFGTRERR